MVTVGLTLFLDVKFIFGKGSQSTFTSCSMTFTEEGKTFYETSSYNLEHGYQSILQSKLYVYDWFRMSRAGTSPECGVGT